MFDDSHGELQVDDAKVDERIAKTCQSSGDFERILHETLRLQFPRGTDGGGGIEPHREHPCRVRPETTDLVRSDIR